MGEKNQGDSYHGKWLKFEQVEHMYYFSSRRLERPQATETVPLEPRVVENSSKLESVAHKIECYSAHMDDITRVLKSLTAKSGQESPAAALWTVGAVGECLALKT